MQKVIKDLPIHDLTSGLANVDRHTGPRTPRSYGFDGETLFLAFLTGLMLGIFACRITIKTAPATTPSINQAASHHSPSPGGEGRGEGER